MPLAPITLFVYNRLDHTKETVAALQKNMLASESDLFVFSDGAKNEEAQSGVTAVREYLQSISGFRSVTINERPENYGLAKSIIEGVTEIINRFGKIIVVEDDLATSPYFLEYMNAALDLYENEARVASIHGYIFPIKQKLPETFFLRGADCWGWGTWKRSWDLFESNSQKLLEELRAKKLSKKFDWGGAYPYTQMLKSQAKGHNNSWAIRWYASMFLQEKLTLYPGKSLVANLGFDDSGTHTGAFGKEFFHGELSNEKINLEKIAIEENADALRQVKKFFRQPALRALTGILRWKYFLRSLKK